MYNKRIIIYWIIWGLLFASAVATALGLYLQRPNTTDFFLPFIFIYFIAVIGAGVVHFFEGYKLSSYVLEHYNRRILLLSNVSMLRFVYSDELSNDNHVYLLKENYKKCVVLFLTIPLSFLIFAGILFIL